MDTAAYYRHWYEKNKEAISAKRREKYRTDPVYRAAYNQAHLHKYRTDPAYREKVRIQQRSYQTTYVAHRRLFRIALNGKLYKAYRRAHIEVFLGTFVNSLAKWEKEYAIPFCIFEAKRRYYTQNQINLLYEFSCLLETQKAHPKNEKVAARIQQHTAKMFEKWYLGSLEGDD